MATSKAYAQYKANLKNNQNVKIIGEVSFGGRAVPPNSFDFIDFINPVTLQRENILFSRYTSRENIIQRISA